TAQGERRGAVAGPAQAAALQVGLDVGRLARAARAQRAAQAAGGAGQQVGELQRGEAGVEFEPFAEAAFGLHAAVAEAEVGLALEIVARLRRRGALHR